MINLVKFIEIFIIEVKRTDIMVLYNKIFMVVLFSLFFINCQGQKNNYNRVKKVSFNFNELYYSLNPKEYNLKDSIVFGYMGHNDSISVFIDDKLVYSGITDYDPRIGKGAEIFHLKRKEVGDFNMYIEFHGKQESALVTLPNRYNSVLIHNELHYFEDMSEFDGFVTIHLYMEDDRFVDYF